MKYFILVIFIYTISCHQKPRSRIPSILDKGLNIVSNDQSGESVIQDIQSIHLAAKRGDVEKLKELVNQGQSIHIENENGQTAFQIASANGHLEAVKFLFSRGANKDKQDKFGYTALQWASLNGHADVVQELLIYNASLSPQNKITGGTALHLATFGGHLTVVQLLVMKIKENNTLEHLIVDNFGQTPYGLAMEKLEMTSSLNSLEGNMDYRAIVDEFEKSFPLSKVSHDSDAELES